MCFFRHLDILLDDDRPFPVLFFFKKKKVFLPPYLNFDDEFKICTVSFPSFPNLQCWFFIDTRSLIVAYY